MDVAFLLAETADDYETDGDFEQQEAPSSSLSKQSPLDILKTSASEVEKIAKIEAQRTFQTEADNIRIGQRDKSSAVVHSRDVSPERSLGKSEAPSKLPEVDDKSFPREILAAADRNAEEGKVDHDVGKDSYDAEDVDREKNKTIEYSDEDEANSEKDNIDDDDDDDDNANGSDADPELDAELLVAAYHGDTRKVDKLLSSGARYFARDRHRWTALMWAVAGGHHETVELLIGFVKKHKLKSFLNAKDSITGWTALHIACTKGKRNCVKLLITSGANIESKSFLQETPLDCLSTINVDDRRIIMHLLRKNAPSSRRRSESKGDD